MNNNVLVSRAGSGTGRAVVDRRADHSRGDAVVAGARRYAGCSRARSIQAVFS